MKIDYATRWEEFFNMDTNALRSINIETLDEENMDALAIRLHELGDQDAVFQVKQIMLESDKTNTGVEYTHIFEDVIIRWMDEKKYDKALNILYSYLKYDEKHCKSYRYDFIKRNIGFCYIALNQEERGWKIIERFLSKHKHNYWNYHDLAFEFFFAKMNGAALNMLERGKKQAEQDGDSAWGRLFASCIERLQCGPSRPTSFPPFIG